MKKKLLTIIPYALALAVVFYALPLLIRDTGSGMFVMLLVIPCLTLICSVIYGMKNGFNLLITIITVIMFVPAVFIFYNSSAWVYIVIYTVISLVGNVIGRALRNNKGK